MMARGGGIGGCWASFSPSWFLEPRPLSSCSTLSPLVSSLLLALSHVADLTAVPLPTTAVSPPQPLVHFERCVNNAGNGASPFGLAIAVSTPAPGRPP
jgi:hypothetical protein